MGLDVNVYAEGSVTDDELAEANAYLKARDVFGFDRGDDPLIRGIGIDGRIEWATLMRFYGHGYERGPWPLIHNGIVCIKMALPQCRVFYGPDSTDYAPEATEALVGDLWKHWLGPEGRAYHDRRTP